MSDEAVNAAGADAPAVAAGGRSLTVAELQAVVAVADLAGRCSTEQRRAWTLIASLLPWYGQRFGKDPWSLPARQVFGELVPVLHEIIGEDLLRAAEAEIDRVVHALASPMAA